MRQKSRLERFLLPATPTARGWVPGRSAAAVCVSRRLSTWACSRWSSRSWMPPPRGRLDILSGVITALTERLCRLDARVLAVELGDPTCARLAEVQVTVADLIRSAQTSMDDVTIKNGVYIKLLRSEVGAKLEESNDLNLKVCTSLIALDGINFRLSLRLDELGESLTAAIRRAEDLETSLEVTPTRGAFEALQTDMISLQKKWEG